MGQLAVTALSMAIVSAGCGGSDQKKAEEAAAHAQAEAAKTTEQAAKTAEQGAKQAAQGLEAMAKGLEAMAGGAGGNLKPVDPVSFRDLQTFFPDLDGWDKQKPTGERMTGKRFILSIEGDNVEDVKALHAIAGKIDFNKLAALQ